MNVDRASGDEREVGVRWGRGGEVDLIMKRLRIPWREKVAGQVNNSGGGGGNGRERWK